MFKNWLLLSFFCFCLGDVLSFYEMQKAFYSCCCVFLFFEIIIINKKRKKEYLLCVLCCFLVFVGGFLAGNGKLATQKHWQALFRKRIILQGAVQPDSLQTREQGISALLETEKPLHGKVKIFVKTDNKNVDLIMQKLLSGKIRITGVVKEPIFLRNPGTYDGYHLNKVKGIYGNMTVPASQLQELGAPLPLRFRFTALTQALREKAFSRLHTPAGAILPGMVLGGYQGVTAEDADMFRDNGIAHLLAVSGTHVAVLTLFLHALLRPVGRKKYIFIQLFLSLYALLCGLQPAVLRSVVMACVLLWGRSQKLKANSARLLVLTAWGMLLVNPFWLFDISFQLSFVTTAGLLLAGSKVTAYLPQCIPDWLRTILGVTLTAQIFSFPFSVYYFHRVSLIGLFSNLLLLPTLELAVLLFLAGLGLMVLETTVGAYIHSLFSFASEFQFGSGTVSAVSGCSFSIAEFLLQGAVAVGKPLAALPFAVTDIASWNCVQYGCYIGFIAAFFDLGPFIRLSSVQRKRWLSGMAGIFLLVCCIRSFYPKDLIVHFMDVGEGDAALVQTPGGKNILIDTGGLQGSADISRLVLLPYLRYLGVKQIDVLCLSHGDHDHAGGAAGVAAKLPVRNVFLGAGAEQSADVQLLLKSLGNKTNIYRLQKGEQWDVGDCRIVVASASNNTSSSAVTETNASSLVLQLFCQGHSLVFGGDADMNTEEKALPLLRPAELLKVSHHGSNTSSSPFYLAHIHPRFGIISVGKNNRYGHPARETLERMNTAGIIPLRTDQLGAIKVVFGKDKIHWYSYRYQENQF